MTAPHPPHLPVPGHRVIINGPGPQDWIDRYETVALLVLASLPIAALAACCLVRRRRRGGTPSGLAWRRSIAEVGLLWGTGPWVVLTLLPASNREAHGVVSLVPLRDLATMPGYQVVGNLLVLAALGLLAPVRWRAFRSVPRLLVLAGCCSVLIETAQYVLELGRVSSVDDVLLNTVGAGLAALVSRPWWRPGVRRSVPPRVINRSVDNKGASA